MSKKSLINTSGKLPADIDSIYACVCDLNGVLRGKRVPVAHADKVFQGKLRMPLSLLNVDIWGEDIHNSHLVFETGDADGLCEYTGRLMTPISAGQDSSALALLWMKSESGEPFQGDPRRALASVLDRYKNLGLTPVVATELEFYLCDPSDPRPQPPRSPVSGNQSLEIDLMSLDQLEQFDAVLDDIYRACESHGIPADTAMSENGAGQFEINLLHVDDALAAADDAILFKRLVRSIARKHGYAGTFMAKPYAERSGSGFHVHFSLLDNDGVNVFDNGADEGSATLLSAIAGMLATMHENMLTFAPHENSYKRLMPGSHAPTTASWGYENRTAAVRIPGGSHSSRRIEHRVAGADANPYLVLASILGGALIGIEQKMTAPDAMVGDCYQQTANPLPVSWAEAIAAFRAGKQVSEIFSSQLQTMLIDCKTQEFNRFAAHVSGFEYRSYFESV